tara:strand:- start:1388 stop:1546 length:159 start_codon:yes stop_codon:yes gene_type:complete
MITIQDNKDGTFKVYLKDKEPVILTDKQFDKLLKETLAEEYPDLVKDYIDEI